MNRAAGIALLVTGVILLVMGINASESLASDVSQFFNGTPTNKSIWLLIVGSVCAVLGIGSVARGGSP